ncbi:MAG: arylsulfatase [Verrucomicrobiales bacterium]|nr:arylsulfatase [Verrucomicrobiales bacterium]
MKRFVPLLIIALCSLVVRAERPNVILIMTDDQGYGDMSVHGNPVLKTPNMDKLHSQSVRFTDFHVAPMCSPTRGQLLTGRDAMKNGCTAVCQGRSMPRSDIPMMSNFFADAGYATGHFGKWHLGDSYPFRPQDRGFQETIHHRAWGITSLADYWANTYFDPVLSHNGTDKKYEGYCTDIFFNESMKWIDAIQTKNKEQGTKNPFFLYLPTNTPHVPNVCEEKYAKPYRGSHEGKPMPAEFYGMIANLDENLGRLEAFLKDRELRDNTILIYMTDNGTQSRQAQAIYNAGMRDKKTSVYEGGHRVPLFVRWPAGPLKHRRDIDDLTQAQDLLPTLIELCSLQAGQSSFDGTSLAGLLKGTESELPDRKLVIQYRVSGAPWDPAVVLWNKWRLVGNRELYHIGRDPGQKTNVAGKNPQIVAAMSAHYDAWHKEAAPLYEKIRWIHVGSPESNPTVLYAQDWTGDYCDNRGGLTRATAKGYWEVIVDRAGTYELEMRRWPRESRKVFIEGFKGPEDKSISARPITAANLQIAGENYTLNIPSETQAVCFRVNLPKGKNRLQTYLLDSQDRILCSSIYVYLKRLNQNEAKLTAVTDRKPTGTAPVTPPRKRGRQIKPARAITLSKNDLRLTNFEGKTYGEWTATGTAFGSGPVTDLRVDLHDGRRVLDTHVAGGGDAATGRLTSPTFEIDRKRINFLVAGGSHKGKTCVNLLIDGKPVLSATGSATKNARGKKVMQWVSWNVAPYRGRQARIEIVDEATRGWGHIVVDHIFQSDKPVK